MPLSTCFSIDRISRIFFSSFVSSPFLFLLFSYQPFFSLPYELSSRDTHLASHLLPQVHTHTRTHAYNCAHAHTYVNFESLSSLFFFWFVFCSFVVFFLFHAHAWNRTKRVDYYSRFNFSLFLTRENAFPLRQHPFLFFSFFFFFFSIVNQIKEACASSGNKAWNTNMRMSSFFPFLFSFLRNTKAKSVSLFQFFLLTFSPYFCITVSLSNLRMYPRSVYFVIYHLWRSS